MECYLNRRRPALTTVFAVVGQGYNLAWYKIESNTITRLTNPSDVVSSYVCKFSNSGAHLGVAGRIYNCDSGLISLKETLVTTSVEANAWSADDYYYTALGGAGTFDVWFRNGTTFTKLGGTLPTVPGQVEACDFSPNSNLIVVGHYTSPYVTTCSRSGSTLAKLTTNIPSSGTTVGACKFSPSGEFFAMGIYQTNFNVKIFGVNGNVFTLLTTLDDVPSAINGLAWSNDSQYLAVTGAVNYVTLYKRSGNTFTKLSYPSTGLAGNGQCAAFSKNDKYLAVGHASSPYFTVYSRSGDVFTKLSNPSTLPTNYISDISFTEI